MFINNSASRQLINFRLLEVDDPTGPFDPAHRGKFYDHGSLEFKIQSELRAYFYMNGTKSKFKTSTAY